MKCYEIVLRLSSDKLHLRRKPTDLKPLDTSVFLFWPIHSVEDRCKVHQCWISLWYHTSYLVNPADYVTRLKVITSKLKATPVHKLLLKKTFIHNNLSSCTHACIQHDVVQKPLQKFYNDTYMYEVLKYSNKLKHQCRRTWQARHLFRLPESSLCGNSTNWAFYHHSSTNPSIPYPY